MIKLQESSKD